MNDRTIVRTVRLPAGKDFHWFNDLNLLALSDRLDAAGRRRAVDQLQAQWRASLPPLMLVS